MTSLADSVLPLIRARADLSRWSASNEHGRQMHEAIDTLETAATTTDPGELYAVTHKALASAIKVIARADDSCARTQRLRDDREVVWPHAEFLGWAQLMNSHTQSIALVRPCVHGVGRRRTRPRSWREPVDESLPFNNS